MAMKHCSKCFEVLPENGEYFYKQKKGKNGFGSECKQCRKSYMRWHHKKNKEKYNQLRKERYQKNKKRETAQVYAYREKNKKKIKEYWAHYYQRNKEQYKSHNKRYREENPGKFKEYSRRRNHRRRQAELGAKFNFSAEEWQQCLAHFNHQCAYCGSKESLEQEHVVPVSVGGHYTADNIIPACKSCNSSKNNKIMQDWFTQHENYSVERMANILKYVQKNKTEVNI